MSLTHTPPGTLDVKSAVRAAKAAVSDLFADEGPTQLGLEEVAYDEPHGRWEVTIGFVRPWLQDAMSSIIQTTKRDYKVITISGSGDVLELRNRDV